MISLLKNVQGIGNRQLNNKNSDNNFAELSKPLIAKITTLLKPKGRKQYISCFFQYQILKAQVYFLYNVLYFPSSTSFHLTIHFKFHTILFMFSFLFLLIALLGPFHQAIHPCFVKDRSTVS